MATLPLPCHARVHPRRVPAVVAHDPTLSHVIRAQEIRLNLGVQGTQELFHVKDRHGAHGASELVVLQHLVEALQVHRVPASQHGRLPQRIEQVLVADWAVVLHRVLDAAMLVAESDRVARSALLAVEELFLPSNSADAAVFAMVLLLVNIVVQEFARPAEVLPHADAAVGAQLRDRLLGVTDETYNRFNGMSVELVPVFRGLVVAMAAVEDVVAAGRPDPAPPPVVLAPEPHLAEAAASLVELHVHWRCSCLGSAAAAAAWRSGLGGRLLLLLAVAALG